MAAIARESRPPFIRRITNKRELSRKVVSIIGRAPRARVCFRCAHKYEIVLGRIDSDLPCERCGKKLRQGVIIQGRAQPKRKDISS